MDALLKTLSEPKRCEIIRLVWSEEKRATEIAEHFPKVTRSAISQHLGVLRRSGLVSERREGTRRLYSVNHQEVARLRAFIDSFWTDSLEKLRDLAELSEQMKGQP
ncbi:MAG: ArsR/SmtB family transcription factor [Acidimicrobiales bacterium]